ncbi:hypothetical protein J3R82DRAFT_8663 [Butyriboletus roseoflavus]|nr:hypothetical protein J3R82DRAFT_8663 [Butyriboletus roseoflavus]
MKVYLSAIKGHVPSNMIQAIYAFFKVCYIAQCNIIYKKSLHDLRHALNHFHQYCEIFYEVSVHNNFSHPHQHSLTHYESLIQLFSTSNVYLSCGIYGICSWTVEGRAGGLRAWYVDTIGSTWYVSTISLFIYLLIANFTAATSSTQPQTQHDDMELDEDEATSVVHESLELAHSDVKLAQTQDELDIALFIYNHSDSCQSM